MHGCGCRIQKQGVAAVIAGGAVRDILMGVLPKDFDLAVGLGTEQLLDLFPDARQSRNQFGTVVLTIGAVRLEITPLRAFGAAPKDTFWEVNLGR
jgi:poly(A) polymerase